LIPTNVSFQDGGVITFVFNIINQSEKNWVREHLLFNISLETLFWYKALLNMKYTLNVLANI